MNSVELELYGVLHDHSGYAVHTRAVARKLITKGFTVRLVSYNNTKSLPFPDLEPYRKTKLSNRFPRIRIIMLPPHPVYQRNRYVILYTMMETRSIHPGVIKRCLTADEVWTPNPHNYNQFVSHLPKNIPVHFMPEGTDPALFKPNGGKAFDRNGYDFIACSVFAWQWRKGPDILLRAWFKAFNEHDNACLIIRSSVLAVNKSDSRRIISEYIQTAKNEFPNKKTAPVKIIEEKIPAEDLPRLYRSCNCFVLPTRGEGWCLPALDAMACGCVPIVTNTGGLSAFCTPSNSVLLNPGQPTNFVPDEFRLMNFFDNQTFDNPRVDDLANALKKAYNKPRLLKSLSKRGIRDAHNNWSWNVSLDPIVHRIKDINFSLLPYKN